MLSHFYTQLSHLACVNQHRFAIVLKGDDVWVENALENLVELYIDKALFQLGGSVRESFTQYAAFNKGQKLLGQECQLLLADCSSGFDANSLAAATGCILGGGLLVVIPSRTPSRNLAERWLERATNSLLVVEQNQPLPQLPALASNTVCSPYSEQSSAIEKVIKVVTGHRKRPLVLTADRGRGKTSALGLASAQLLTSRKMKILVTAPSMATVQPLFHHAVYVLNDVVQSKGKLIYDTSSIEFIAPDELLRTRPQCDLLLVDEASAIPIPMLKRMVDLYHRAVFSTTIHGYEGCGRGFSLKFQTWLKSQRPGTNFSHLEQPIRWATGDPLENWVFDTFLLNGELDIIENENRPKVLQRIEKVTLFENPQLLNSIFALLVNAHYQTTPNDLILLLGDETIHLYTMMQGEHCIGCVLTIEEGGLEGELAEQILLGKRRPKGELVASLLTNQLGLKQAATEQSLRVMRIAVHPELQGQGLGSTMLTQLVRDTSYDFYSTSFGATEELVNFWCSNGFKPLKLGSQRDQASGTHSLVMVKSDSDWLVQAQQRFVESLHYLLSDRFKNIETELVRSLLANDNASEANRALPRLVELYIGGSSNYDSIAFELYEWIKLNPNKLSQVSDLVIRKLMQKHTWQQCVEEYNLIGRKQAEQQFKVDLLALNN